MTDSDILRRLSLLEQGSADAIDAIRLNTPYFQDLYDANSTLSWHKFNELTGAAYDFVSGAGHTPANADWGWDSDGAYVQFDGVGSYIDFGAGTGYFPAAGNVFSVDIMCKPAGDLSGILMWKAVDSTMATDNSTIIIDASITVTGDMSFALREAGVAKAKVGLTPLYSAGQLTHLRYQYNGPAGTMLWYMNDMRTPIINGGPALGGNVANTNVENLWIGRDKAGTSTDYFAGKIYEIMINPTLTRGQVLPV